MMFVDNQCTYRKDQIVRTAEGIGMSHIIDYTHIRYSSYTFNVGNGESL
jgi:hypothetical protein